MAETVQVDGVAAKLRSPVWVAVLGIVTLGIYVIFWWYFVNREMADYGRAKGTSELGDSPGKSVLAITLGALIIVPAVMSIISTFKRVQAAQRIAGAPSTINGWIGFILLVVFSPAFYGYMQSGLNDAWRSALGQAAAPTAPAAAPTPQ
jgi:uncharacterized membrane protein HdeD (DUF308 family)